MVGFYNYTVILTYVGFSSALIGILSAFNGNPAVAVICLLFCALCDAFDGKIARTRKRTEEEKSFGIQIDSLSDLVCFGVLPAVIAISLGCNRWYYMIILILFVLCGLIRLAYFNVTEIVRSQETTAKRTEYRGLPIVFSALFLPIAFVLQAFLPENITPLFLTVVLGGTGIAFISPITIRKPGKAKLIFLIVLGLVLLGLVIWLSSQNKI